MKEHFEALNTLASQFDGLPKIAYIRHLSEKFTITEIMAAAIVESWLSLGESNGMATYPLLPRLRAQIVGKAR